jgi:hypothetical protein
MVQVLRMPSEAELPCGPRRDFTEQLFSLYKEAHRGSEASAAGLARAGVNPLAAQPVDVTLCITIGRGLAGRAGRAVGLGPDWRANVEQTSAGNGLHEETRNGHNARSGRVGCAARDLNPQPAD